MATITPTWTENQSLLSGAALDASSQTTLTLDLDTNGFDAVSIQAKIVFGSTPDSITSLKIYASPNSGTDVDNIPIGAYEIIHTASSTQIASVLVQNSPYIEIVVQNLDSADTVTASIVYAGRKWSSA